MSLRTRNISNAENTHTHTHTHTRAHTQCSSWALRQHNAAVAIYWSFSSEGISLSHQKVAERVQLKLLSLPSLEETFFFKEQDKYCNSCDVELLPFRNTVCGPYYWTQLVEMPSLSPGLLWVSGLSASLQSERSPVQSPVRAHAWVGGQVPGWGCVRGNWSMYFLHIDVSLPLFLLPFPCL